MTPAPRTTTQAEPVLVVGSIAFDSIQTPHGQVEEELGGSATHFSSAARFYCPVRLVGVVGADFPPAFRRVLEELPVDTRGLEVRDGETFRWSGRYQGTMNRAETLAVALNVFGDFHPQVPSAFTDTPFVFLANGSPQTQNSVLDQLAGPRWVVLDTMNLWIDRERPALERLLRRVHCLMLNKDEARQLTGASNLIEAGRRVLSLGPSAVVIKKGEHGALLLYEDRCYPVPAYPVERVVDPTGAGDSFAGGLVGYLASRGRADRDTLRAGLVHATVMASFNVEDFGLRRLARATRTEIEARVRDFGGLLLPPGLDRA